VAKLAPAASQAPHIGADALRKVAPPPPSVRRRDSWTPRASLIRYGDPQQTTMLGILGPARVSLNDSGLIGLHGGRPQVGARRGFTYPLRSTHGPAPPEGEILRREDTLLARASSVRCTRPRIVRLLDKDKTWQ
jgi:hypothetical protein